MKKCTKCEEIKELTGFSVRKASVDGLVSRCKVCDSLIKKQDYLKNPQKHKVRVKRYQVNNIEKVRAKKREQSKRRTLENPEYIREYYKNNKEKYKYVSTPENREKNRLRSAKDRPKRKAYYANYVEENKEELSLKKKIYKKNNPGKVRASGAKRRAKKIEATIGNYQETLEIIYSTTNGVSDYFEVDHIIPLIHKDVCGLHVPRNLQILTTKQNLKKSNKFDGTNLNNSWES